MEDYLSAAAIGFYTSQAESFCLSILEAMYFACPSVAPQWEEFPKSFRTR
jgi:glycosyltransferase involved in cell wall biosynthesis